MLRRREYGENIPRERRDQALGTLILFLVLCEAIREFSVSECSEARSRTGIRESGNCLAPDLPGFCPVELGQALNVHIFSP